MPLGVGFGCEDGADAADAVPPRGTLRCLVPEFGEFGCLADHLVEGSDREQLKIVGEVRQRFIRPVICTGRFAAWVLRRDERGGSDSLRTKLMHPADLPGPSTRPVALALPPPR
ncbi:hypothetical protein GCM10018775_92380 [Streptomyces umbrinus]|nr:hypothetical protein GCM10018775_92380 [Streptomyces umbrinus]